MNIIKPLFKWVFRFTLLLILFIALFISGSMAVSGVMPANPGSEPGLVPESSGLIYIAVANVAVISALILSSRWRGLKLALGLAFVFYGSVTFVMQIETWYFLSEITVGPQLLLRLFLMGIPTAFIFIPLAVWILGKGRLGEVPNPHPESRMPIKQWIWKMLGASLIYLTLYWLAGYFIAWQNPELRVFYGSPGEALPFFVHTADTLKNDPTLFPFQILRGWIWVLCALPLIRGSHLNPWWTAMLVGLMFSIPQNIGHILPNPLIPVASVRLSHLIETASSTFVFGLAVVWLFHREHRSLKDLFGNG